MKQKNLYKFIVFVFIVLIFKNIEVKADDVWGPTFNQMTGDFEYTTSDKKATTKITWGNKGFNISLKKTSGNPMSDGKVITIYYDGVNADHEIDSSGERKITKYWIKGEYLRKKIDEKYGKGYYDNELRDGDLIYFNNIFQVYHDGKEYGSKIHTLEGIKRAEYWGPGTMADFPNHFDRPVRLYKAPPEILPAQVLYRIWLNGKWVDIDGPKNLPKEKWGKLGANTSHTYALTKEYNGVKYKLYRSYYTTIKSGGSGKRYNDLMVKKGETTLDEVQHQKGKILESGTLFVGLMKTDAPPPPDEPDNPDIPDEDEKEEILEGIFTPPNSNGKIAADDRGSERFNVLEGIPTTENLYTNVFSEEYLSGYLFKKKIVKKTYPVKVSRTYTLTWVVPSPPTPEGIPMPPIPQSQTVTKTTTIDVERKGSYWYIENFDVYGINDATVENYALPNGITKLNPSGYNPPMVDYTVETEHMKDPEKWEKSIQLNSITLNGGTAPPSIDQIGFENDAKQRAESGVGKIQVRNDYLKFNNDILMNNNYVEEKTEVPEEIPECMTNIDENVLYKNLLFIDGVKHNGVEESSGEISYKRIASVNSKLKPVEAYEIEGINSVTIHTPVVCDAQVENMNYMNQMIVPNIGYNSLVLDTSFHITLPTVGEHKYIQGYGYRDYKKYTSDRQVMFPFDVYRANGNIFVPKNTWISINQSDTTKFYLPIWVDEDTYTLQFRTIAINTYANGKINQVEYLKNEELQNYVATDTIQVEVSGRLYGLNLYDISDYPIWQNVFRKPSSLYRSGFNYMVGVNDRNGDRTARNGKYTLPLINGSHPKLNNIGAIKTGYVTRFNLQTIGNMYTEKDYINIRPKFYHVDNTGQNRQEVDVYYSETFNNKKNIMVKMGSDKDKENIKVLKTGDKYLGIANEELSTAARLNNKSVIDWKAQKKNIYTYTNIMIPDSLRTYIGTNYTPTGSVPVGVDSDKVTKSMQSWYCEYYMPAEIHVTTKNFNVEEYSKKNGPFDYNEDFWLKDGYLIINFDIESIKNGQRHLSYINEINEKMGYCNMWKLEGFNYSKTDYKNSKFDFVNGDYVMYFVNKFQSASRDYISAGTH